MAKLLIVDDSTMLRDMLNYALNEGGYTDVVEAVDGVDGLAKAKNTNFDLIITDVNMPILNGLDMIKEIKKININIPIIVATAFSNKEYLLEAIDIGVDKYVLKPIDIAKLLQVMSQSLIYHELKDLYTDKLTNLPNRNKLKKDLDENNIELMALLDVDEFSTINDLFGEKIGDNILFELGNKLKNHFKEDEYLVYRIEADKFTIVSKKNNHDVNEFYDICKAFADKIEKESLLIDEDEIDINITIGIAQGDGARAFKYSQRVINYARSKLQRIMIYNESFKIQQSFEDNIKWVKQLKQDLEKICFKHIFNLLLTLRQKKFINMKH